MNDEENPNYQIVTDHILTEDQGSGDDFQTSSSSRTYLGHSFVKKNIHKPTTCYHCCDMLWAILNTHGVVCEICNFLTHEKCMKSVVSPCTCIIPFLVQDPVAHCWSDVTHFKRKFCNVCRKRLDDLDAVRCEICEYYAHFECLDFVSSDCRQCSVSNVMMNRKESDFEDQKQMDTILSQTADEVVNFKLSDPGNNKNKSSSVFEGLHKTVSYSLETSSPKKSFSPTSNSPTCNLPSNASFSELSSLVLSDSAGSTASGGPGQSGAVLAQAVASSGRHLANTAFVGVPGMSLAGQDQCPGSNSATNLSNMSLSQMASVLGSCIQHPVTYFNNVGHRHHWREGNLPQQSKCIVCKKTCSSVECFTGLRCEWCGITAHYTCYKSTSSTCDFGSLHDIILPPSAVSLPRTSILMEHFIGMMRPQPESYSTVGAQTDEFSSSGDSPEESGFEKKSIRDKNDRDFDDYVRVYDGLARYKKRHCRYLSLGKSVTIYKVIELSLKAFQLPPDEVKDFCLVEINERDDTERKLDGNTSFKSQLTFETRRPQIILRYKDRYADIDFINVYPGTLSQYRSDILQNPIQVPIRRKSTAQDAIQIVLKKFNLDNLQPNSFHLVESVLDSGLSERVVPNDERLWDIIDKVKRESVRSLRLTRFSVRPVEDPHGPSVALFVGNLKKGLTQLLYEKLLLDMLGNENKWDSIDVIYYDFGSIVLLYSDAVKADKAYNRLKNSLFEDRPILVMILPRLLPSRVPDDVQPLLVFVNVKSGGCQGIELITSFRKLLNPHQVFNLDYGGPLPGLYCFRLLKKFKILVCGGDGTVGWALSCLDNVGQDAQCQSPPMAILPLGTGNDLARVLRWGSGYAGTEEPLQILKDVVEAEEIFLDRWTVVIKPKQAEADQQKKQMQIEANTSNTNEDTSRIFVMNNYFGIGIDADLNLDFHTAREENPAKFNSRIHNKSVYFKMGLKKMVNRTKCEDLHQNIILEVDGRQIDLPPLEGIIILNILSWGAGAKPWGDEKDENFQKPTHHDGKLEVVGVTGVVHMGQIFSGIRTGSRLAQGGHIRITLKSDIPVQVDGEPWIQAPGQIIVLKSALKATMLKKRKRRKVNRRHTEPGLSSQNNPNAQGGGTGPNAHQQTSEGPGKGKSPGKLHTSGIYEGSYPQNISSSSKSVLSSKASVSSKNRLKVHEQLESKLSLSSNTKDQKQARGLSRIVGANFSFNPSSFSHTSGPAGPSSSFQSQGNSQTSLPSRGKITFDHEVDYDEVDEEEPYHEDEEEEYDEEEEDFVDDDDQRNGGGSGQNKRCGSARPALHSDLKNPDSPR